jgi:hypothetical protein
VVDGIAHKSTNYSPFFLKMLSFFRENSGGTFPIPGNFFGIFSDLTGFQMA